MRDYKQDFNDTCQLMRKYMHKIQPQSFASLWRLYQEQKHRCKIYDIKVQDTTDIEEYAKVEKIERFGFE